MSKGIEQVQLGRAGVRVTNVCLGTMTFGQQTDEAGSFAIMDVAAEHGVTFIDVADVYPANTSALCGKTEEIVGKWLRGKRDDYVLASKGFNRTGPGANDYGSSRRHVIAALDASLRRLQTDYIDLYYLHRWDPSTPLEETLGVLDDLCKAGKIRYAGVSNALAYQLMAALWTSDVRNLIRFSAIQSRYNMLFREMEREIIPAARENGVAMIAYNPLAAGVLTGKYEPGSPPQEGTRFTTKNAATYQKRYWQEEQIAAAARLKAELAKRGKSLTHVALRWVLDQPGVTCAIVGASRAEQLRDSLQGPAIELDDEDRAACDRLWYEIPRRSPLEEGSHEGNTEVGAWR